MDASIVHPIPGTVYRIPDSDSISIRLRQNPYAGEMVIIGTDAEWDAIAAAVDLFRASESATKRVDA